MTDDRACIAVPMPASEGGPYDAVVYLGSDGQDVLRAELEARFSGRKLVVVCDPGAARAPEWAATLRAPLVMSEAGEPAKKLSAIEALASQLVAHGVDRDTVLVAIGGGAVGDSAGFVASTLLRGIDYVQVPTTLLAMVDSSIGGKTAVNLPAAKNLLGAFHQPRFVFADLCWMETLPARDRAAGLGEVLKHALLGGEEALHAVERDAEALATGPIEGLFDVVVQAVTYKASVVAADPRERGTQRITLNLGHTVGHALERASHERGAPLRHGEAVALGLLAEAQLGRALGHWQEGPARLAAVLPRLGISHALTSTLASFSDEVMMTALLADKKRAGGALRFVLLDAPGRPVIVELDGVVAVEMLRVQNAADTVKHGGGSR
ncbi:MAG: 3-dehydroquinate synthase family protein [Polyangia bacterium]